MRRLVLLIAALMLSACGSSEQQELQQWMTQQRSATKPRVTPLPEPSQFSPQAYAQDGSVDPFSKQKLVQAFRRDADQTSANAVLIAPELNRRKEVLESMALDAMVMVGSLAKAGKNGELVALIQVDNLLYQARLGNYLGQNYGRVIKISETEVVLREIVQDAGGEWVERKASLQLQEKSK